HFERILRSGDPDIPETYYIGDRARRWRASGWDRWVESRKRKIAESAPVEPPANDLLGHNGGPPLPLDDASPAAKRKAPKRKPGRPRKPSTSPITPVAE